MAHHLWWNSGLPREAMHNAMKAAYYSTRNVYRKQTIARPMAHFFTALKTATVDQQVPQGRRRTG